MKIYLLFNPYAGNGKCTEAINDIEMLKDNQVVFCDMTEIADMTAFVSGLDKEDVILICGGDGTLNNFFNSVNTDVIENDILYFAAGNGNDFLHDLGFAAGKEPFKINDYIKDLPVLTAKGRKFKFINGIGYGMDGYCCEEVNRIKDETGKPGNYTAVALKGLAFDFKPVNATVIVDGKEYNFKKVWLAPTMKGRYFGGGMKIAPTQDRNDPESKLSLVVAHDLSKLKILALFITVFKGTHIKFKKNVTILKGHSFKVRFDRPCSMQIDGETLTDVPEYSVEVPVKVTV